MPVDEKQLKKSEKATAERMKYALGHKDRVHARMQAAKDLEEKAKKEQKRK